MTNPFVIAEAALLCSRFAWILLSAITASSSQSYHLFDHDTIHVTHNVWNGWYFHGVRLNGHAYSLFAHICQLLWSSPVAYNFLHFRLCKNTAIFEPNYTTRPPAVPLFHTVHGFFTVPVARVPSMELILVIILTVCPSL